MRRAERVKSSGHWLRLKRPTGSQGEQLVNLNDVSPLGVSVLDLDGRPFRIGDCLTIVDSSFPLPQIPVKAIVKHITKTNTADGEIFIIGMEFQQDKSN